MKVFHTAYLEIQDPDIYHGRKNADFGQGFYMSDSDDFAGQWAIAGPETKIYVNRYELSLEGINVKIFKRDMEWINYILDNRRLKKERYPEADVVIGPIANDTIFDMMGIISSGFLSPEESLDLLKLGPEYKQIVVKTEKGRGNLKWLSSKVVSGEEFLRCKEKFAHEESIFQEEVAKKMAD